MQSQLESPTVVKHFRFVLFFGTGICKKKYPFKNSGSECANPPPVPSKLKVHSRVTCRSSEKKYPFCKSVCGRNILSTLTTWGVGWIRQTHEYRKGTFFCKYRGQILSGKRNLKMFSANISGPRITRNSINELCFVLAFDYARSCV